MDLADGAKPCLTCLDLNIKLEKIQKAYEKKDRLSRLLKEFLCKKHALKVKQETLPADYDKKLSKDIEDNNYLRNRLVTLTETVNKLIEEKQSSFSVNLQNKLIIEDYENNQRNFQIANQQLHKHLQSVELELEKSKKSLEEAQLELAEFKKKKSRKKKAKDSKVIKEVLSSLSRSNNEIVADGEVKAEDIFYPTPASSTIQSPATSVGDFPAPSPATSVGELPAPSPAMSVGDLPPSSPPASEFKVQGPEIVIQLSSPDKSPSLTDFRPCTPISDFPPSSPSDYSKIDYFDDSDEAISPIKDVQKTEENLSSKPSSIVKPITQNISNEMDNSTLPSLPNRTFPKNIKSVNPFAFRQKSTLSPAKLVVRNALLASHQEKVEILSNNLHNLTLKGPEKVYFSNKNKYSDDFESKLDTTSFNSYRDRSCFKKVTKNEKTITISFPSENNRQTIKLEAVDPQEAFKKLKDITEKAKSYEEFIKFFEKTEPKSENNLFMAALSEIPKINGTHVFGSKIFDIFPQQTATKFNFNKLDMKNPFEKTQNVPKSLFLTKSEDEEPSNKNYFSLKNFKPRKANFNFSLKSTDSDDEKSKKKEEKLKKSNKMPSKSNSSIIESDSEFENPQSQKMIRRSPRNRLKKSSESEEFRDSDCSLVSPVKKMKKSIEPDSSTPIKLESKIPKNKKQKSKVKSLDLSESEEFRDSDCSSSVSPVKKIKKSIDPDSSTKLETKRPKNKKQKSKIKAESEELRDSDCLVSPVKKKKKSIDPDSSIKLETEQPKNKKQKSKIKTLDLSESEEITDSECSSVSLEKMKKSIDSDSSIKLETEHPENKKQKSKIKTLDLFESEEINDSECSSLSPEKIKKSIDPDSSIKLETEHPKNEKQKSKIKTLDLSESEEINDSECSSVSPEKIKKSIDPDTSIQESEIPKNKQKSKVKAGNDFRSFDSNSAIKKSEKWNDSLEKRLELTSEDSKKDFEVTTEENEDTRQNLEKVDLQISSKTMKNVKKNKTVEMLRKSNRLLKLKLPEEENEKAKSPVKPDCADSSVMKSAVLPQKEKSAIPDYQVTSKGVKVHLPPESLEKRRKAAEIFKKPRPPKLKRISFVPETTDAKDCREDDFDSILKEIQENYKPVFILAPLVDNSFDVPKSDESAVSSENKQETENKSEEKQNQNLSDVSQPTNEENLISEDAEQQTKQKNAPSTISEDSSFISDKSADSPTNEEKKNLKNSKPKRNLFLPSSRMTTRSSLKKDLSQKSELEETKKQPNPKNQPDIDLDLYVDLDAPTEEPNPVNQASDKLNSEKVKVLALLDKLGKKKKRKNRKKKSKASKEISLPTMSESLEELECPTNALECAWNHFTTFKLPKKNGRKLKHLTKAQVTQVQKKLKNFMAKDDVFSILPNLVNRLHKLAHHQMAQIILNFLDKDPQVQSLMGNGKTNFEFTKVQDKILVLLFGIFVRNKEFLDEMLLLIERKIMSFDVKNMIEVNISYACIHTILCKKFGLFLRTRTLIYDIFYIRQFKAYPVVSRILYIWPESFPNYKPNEECLMGHTIAQICIQIPSYWPKDSTIVKKFCLTTLNHTFTRKLGYNEKYGFKYEYEDLFSKLVNNILIEGNDMALIMLCKCVGYKFACHEMRKEIYPRIITNNETIDENTLAKLILTSGKICKGFPPLEASFFISEFTEAIGQILIKSSSTIVCEAIVGALSQVKKFNTETIVKFLSLWEPKNKKLSIPCALEIRKILCMRSLKKWRYKFRTFEEIPSLSLL